MSKNTVLVTGATGFVGSSLVRHLSASGFKVHVLIRKESDLSSICKDKKFIDSHIYDGTIFSLKSILSKVNPSHVFHLAALFLAEHNESNIDELLYSNIHFSTQLVDAMVSEKIPYLVNTGTSWQHYKNADYNPVNLYAATKQAFENILKFYVEASSLRVVTLSLFDTFGPNDARKKVLRVLWEAKDRDVPLKMSPGEQKINLVYIDDVVRAFEMAFYYGKNMRPGHEKFGIRSDNDISLRDLVNLFESSLDINLKIDWGGREYRKREVMVPWDGGPGLPGWRPEVSIREGLQRTFGDLK